MSETERLIEAVRAHPVIYDTSHADNKNARKREEAWFIISESLNGDTDWKKKWKNLKDTYVKYLKTEYLRSSKLKKNGSIKRYKSWPWATKLEFIRPFYRNSKASSNATEKLWFELPDDIFSEDSSKDYTDKERDPCEVDKPDVKPILEGGELAEPQIQHVNVDSIINKSKANSLLSNERKRYADNYSNCDDIELILMGYAKTIRKFSPKRQAIVKFKFSQILMEEELAQQVEDEEQGTSAKKKQKLRSRRSDSWNDSSN